MELIRRNCQDAIGACVLGAWRVSSVAPLARRVLPVILYAVAQGWSPRVMKAMLQAFFLVNQSVIVADHWWAGLLTREVAWLACLYVVPSAIGVTAGLIRPVSAV
jgi:hypothetical protein